MSQTWAPPGPGHPTQDQHRTEDGMVLVRVVTHSHYQGLCTQHRASIELRPHTGMVLVMVAIESHLHLLSSLRAWMTESVTNITYNRGISLILYFYHRSYKYNFKCSWTDHSEDCI